MRGVLLRVNVVFENHSSTANCLVNQGNYSFFVITINSQFLRL